MKLIKYILILFIAQTFLNCGSVSNYTVNDLNKKFFDTKTVYFTLNENSLNEMTITGMAAPILGGFKKPDVKEVFKKSIEELAKETKLNLKFIENSEHIADSISNNKSILIDAEITEMLWSFGFSIATFKTNVNYNIQNNTKHINTIGIRKSGGGSESNNLRKSLKNANYKLLLELEK